MNPLDRAIAAVAPGWAVKRAVAARQLQRLYEAGEYNHHYPQRASNTHADVAVQRAGSRLRDQARFLEENDGLAVAIFDDLVNFVAGSGTSIEPMALTRSGEPHETLNGELAELWDEFSAAPDITGELAMPALEQLVVRHWLRDGELFTQEVTDSRAPHRNALAFSLECLEADFVPFDDLPGTARRNVVHGVEKNDWGQAVAYHVHKQHPTDYARTTLTGHFETKRVPARAMIHLKFVRRLHQTRGVPIVHAVIRSLGDIKNAWESERLAMRVAAAMVVAIRRELGTAGLPENLIDDASRRAFDIDNGMVWDNLLPGEGPEVISSDRPNRNFEPFTKALQRTISGGTGTRYSAISRDYNGTYSAQRQELVEAVIGYRRLFAHYRDRWVKRVRRTLIQQAIMTRRLQLPRDLDDATLYRAEYRPPVLPWISPSEEVDAYKTAIEARLISPQQAIRDLGRDPREVKELIERWGQDPAATEEPQNGQG